MGEPTLMELWLCGEASRTHWWSLARLPQRHAFIHTHTATCGKGNVQKGKHLTSGRLTDKKKFDVRTFLLVHCEARLPPRTYTASKQRWVTETCKIGSLCQGKCWRMEKFDEGTFTAHEECLPGAVK